MSHNTVINQEVTKSILIISLNSIQDWLKHYFPTFSACDPLKRSYVFIGPLNSLSKCLEVVSNSTKD